MHNDDKDTRSRKIATFDENNLIKFHKILSNLANMAKQLFSKHNDNIPYAVALCLMMHKPVLQLKITYAIIICNGQCYMVYQVR